MLSSVNYDAPLPPASTRYEMRAYDRRASYEAKAMQERGMKQGARHLAQFYTGLIDASVLDEQRAHVAEFLRSLGITPLIAQTL